MKIVRKSYDQLLAKEKFYRILNNYRELILRQSYDSLMINLKIFCKSGPSIIMTPTDLSPFRYISHFIGSFH